MTDVNWALARKRQNLEERARIIQAIRAFFIDRRYLEVETPLRIPANAPEPYIDAVPSGSWFLQTSPELAMKRLLAAGYERLFQISHCWREGERGQFHLPEFTMLEWYQSGVGYRHLMTDCEELLRALIPGGVLHWQDSKIDLATPWERLSVHRAFDRYAGVAVEKAMATDRFEELLTEKVEPQLGIDRPTFLVDYPIELGALARRKPDNPEIAERFELYIAGLEIANAFSELTDSTEQRQRFTVDEAHRRAAGKPACPSPEPFLRELEQLPEAAGIALGIDRLIMLMTDNCDISEVVAFPPETL